MAIDSLSAILQKNVTHNSGSMRWRDGKQYNICMIEQLEPQKASSGK
jgi:hypothetical protein